LRDIAHELGLATSLDQIWRSPTFPMWLTLAAAGFFALHPADHAAARREIGRQWRADGDHAAGDRRCRRRDHPRLRVRGPQARRAAPRAAAIRDGCAAGLSCIDDLAGETVLAACEKALFGSADAAAAAVSYAAAQLTQLTSFGDVASANKNMTPSWRPLRRRRARPLWPDGLCAVCAGSLQPPNAPPTGR
jgi:hypothetical protein